MSIESKQTNFSDSYKIMKHGVNELRKTFEEKAGRTSADTSAKALSAR
jgi:hypothetical protein